MGMEGTAGLLGWMQSGSVAGPMLQQNIREHETKKQREFEQGLREREIQNQKEFAQHGIQWKVADARAAGIHPLYALGANTISYAPQSIGQSSPDHSLSDSVGNAMSSMGQNISRAVNASETQQQREMNQLTIANARTDLEGKQIDNQIRASQLQNMRATGPAFPSPMDGAVIPGQGNSVNVKPSEVYASQSGKPGVQSGAINTLQYTRETDGSVGIAPSADAKERLEDDFIAESMWHIRNRSNPPPPTTKEIPIPENLKRQGYKYWLWSPFQQKFIPSKNP